MGTLTRDTCQTPEEEIGVRVHVQCPSPDNAVVSINVHPRITFLDAIASLELGYESQSVSDH